MASTSYTCTSSFSHAEPLCFAFLAIAGFELLLARLDPVGYFKALVVKYSIFFLSCHTYFVTCNETDLLQLWIVGSIASSLFYNRITNVLLLICKRLQIIIFHIALYHFTFIEIKMHAYCMAETVNTWFGSPPSQNCYPLHTTESCNYPPPPHYQLKFLCKSPSLPFSNSLM